MDHRVAKYKASDGTNMDPIRALYRVSGWGQYGSKNGLMYAEVSSSTNDDWGMVIPHASRLLTSQTIEHIQTLA